MENKEKQLIDEYEYLEKDIHTLEEQEREKRKELREIQEKIIKIRQESNSELKNQDVIIPTIERMFKALEKDNYNDKLVCNHFGVFCDTGIWNIEIVDYNYDKKLTQIVFEIKDKWVADTEVGCSKIAWDNIRGIIEKKYGGIFDEWNGNERNYTMSVILKRAIPKSLLTALKNYDKNSGKDTFDEIFSKNLKEVEE